MTTITTKLNENEIKTEITFYTRMQFELVNKLNQYYEKIDSLNNILASLEIQIRTSKDPVVKRGLADINYQWHKTLKEIEKESEKASAVFDIYHETTQKLETYKMQLALHARH